MTSSDRTGATQPGGFSRRDLIVSAAAMGAASLAERPSIAADLPPRGEFIIRGADVVSMDPAVGDLRGDVHVRGGEIVAVGAEYHGARRGHDRRPRHDRASGADRQS